INRFCGPGTISTKAPYHWLRGVTPRVPMRSVIAMILSEHLGETIDVNDLWPCTRTPSGVRVVWSSADGPGQSWFGDAVIAAIDWLVTPTRRPVPRQDGPPVDEGMLDALRDRVDQLRALGEGGSPLLADWGAQDLKWAQRLVAKSSYDTETARVLARVIAELAHLVGWLYAQANQWEKARKYLATGLDAVARSGDRGLGGYIVACLGYVCLRSGETDIADQLLKIARKGCAGLPPSPGLALMAARQAQVHALRGEAEPCRSRVEEAARLLATTRPAAITPWNSWIGNAVLLGEAGRAWLDLGLLDQAERDLLAAVDGVGEGMPTIKALYLASLAETRLRLGRIDGAADAALDALTQHRDSAWCRDRLARLGVAFAESREVAAREAVLRIGEWLTAT
ncbi:MAG TPA: hypothetical protein VHZ97_29795, partial [Pseudonocardiaceae bacterium]|nr:hypothetical protein [Pseudonocardiaceae bacterium]